VLSPRPRYRIRHIEIIVYCLILVIWRVSQLESAKYLDVRKASRLRVIHPGNPHRLSGQWARGGAETGDAGEARAKLIDGPRGQNVSLSERQITVPKITKCREPWYGSASERQILIRVRKEELCREAIRFAQVKVDVGIELVFIVTSGQDCCVVHTASRSLWARDYKGSILVSSIQQIERNRVNV
jgi:hypothetical protein